MEVERYSHGCSAITFLNICSRTGNFNLDEEVIAPHLETVESIDCRCWIETSLEDPVIENSPSLVVLVLLSISFFKAVGKSLLGSRRRDEGK